MNLHNKISSLLIAVSWVITSFNSYAEDVPLLIPYSGNISVDGQLFNGVGEFKFAIVNASCANVVDVKCESYWSNDSRSENGKEPEVSVKLPVTDGKFYVKLGDTSLAGMTEMPLDVFKHETSYLRIWFDDGVNGFQQLSNDKQFISVPYAYFSKEADIANKVSDGSILSTSIADNAVGMQQINAQEVQTRIQPCGEDESIQTVFEDGSVGCLKKSVYSASGGLVASNNDISIEPSVMAKIESFAIKPINPGSGLVSSSTDGIQTIAIENGGVTDSHISAMGWNKVTGVPADLLDGDQGITVEADPTVPANIKDGIIWSEVTDKPAGFQDNVDNQGLTTAGTGLSSNGTDTVSINDTTMSLITSAAKSADMDTVKTFIGMMSCSAMTRFTNFDYTTNNGIVTVGTGTLAFDLQFDAIDTNQIRMFNDPANIDSIAYAKSSGDPVNATSGSISEITDAASHTPAVRDIVVPETDFAILKNTSGNYAVVHIGGISPANEVGFDRVNFSYCIRPFGQTDFR